MNTFVTVALFFTAVTAFIFLVWFIFDTCITDYSTNKTSDDLDNLLAEIKNREREVKLKFVKSGLCPDCVKKLRKVRIGNLEVSVCDECKNKFYKETTNG